MSETTKFVILGTQRTGTTLIRTTLDSHPDIQCYGEVFNLGKKSYSGTNGYLKYSTNSVYRRLRSIFDPQTVTDEYLQHLFVGKYRSAVGFKLMLTHSNARPYILKLLMQNEIKAILVVRRNALKTLISRRTAASSGVYHVSKTLRARSAVEKWNANKIVLNCNDLLSDLHGIQSEIQNWRSLVGDSMSIFELFYEDYLLDQVSKNRELQAFLNVDQQDLMSDLKKVNPDKLSDVVSNFDEVQRTLANTEYQEFLEI